MAGWEERVGGGFGCVLVGGSPRVFGWTTVLEGDLAGEEASYWSLDGGRSVGF